MDSQFLARLFRARADIIRDATSELDLNIISETLAKSQIREYESLARLVEEMANE